MSAVNEYKTTKKQTVLKLKRKNMNFKRTVELTLMTLPAMILLIVFNYTPMFGLVIAFKDFRYDTGILMSKWVGLKNFEFFYKSQDAGQIIWNTILMNLIFIVTVLFGALLLAVMLNEVKNKFLIKTYQTVLLLPFFLSMTVVANIVYGFLEYKYGIANKLRSSFGLDKIIWYNESQYWRGILTAVNWWKNVGYNMVIFYAGIIGIDSTYYEAASIDGATKIKMLTKITLPMIIPLIITMFLLQAGSILNADIGLFYVVTRNSAMLYDTVDIIDTYVYRALTGGVGDIGMTAAIGFFQSVTGLILVVFSNFMAKRYSEKGSIF